MSKIDDLFASEADVRPHEDVPVVFRGALVTIRISQVPGTTWAEACAKNPFRPDVPVDINYGYNVHGVAATVVPICATVVEDDETIELGADRWAELVSSLNGHDFSAVTDAVYRLNEYNPALAVERLKKASTRGSGKKRG